MAFVRQRISALISVAPRKARILILNAMRRSGTSRRDAAHSLGCSEDSLARWIKQLDLTERLEQMAKTAKDEGWHHDNVGGRPPSASTKKKAKKKCAPKEAREPAPEVVVAAPEVSRDVA